MSHVKPLSSIRTRTCFCSVVLFILHLTTFMAELRVYYWKVARWDINFSTKHGEILKTSTALLLMKTLFNSSLWYCIYTLQYSAKKLNVQLHKYKILPPWKWLKHSIVSSITLCDVSSKTDFKALSCHCFHGGDSLLGWTHKALHYELRMNRFQSIKQKCHQIS